MRSRGCSGSWCSACSWRWWRWWSSSGSRAPGPRRARWSFPPRPDPARSAHAKRAPVDRTQLLDVLDQVKAGVLAPAEAAVRIGELPFREVAHAVGTTVIDHHRELRTGVPELVYGAGKTPAQTADALRELVRGAGGGIATRVDAVKAAAVQALLPAVQVHELARIV